MKNFIAASAAFALFACGAEQSADTPDAEPAQTAEADDSHGPIGDPNAVDEFRTSAMIDLSTAVKTKTSGVPADDYGRPLSYRGLDGQVPDFAAAMHGGGDATQDMLAGQWTVLKFWGAWCGDCVKDGSFVDRLTKALADEPDIQFLSIHTPPSFERRDEAMGKWGSLDLYFEDKGLEYPVIMDPDAAIREAFMIDWTPTYLLVGPDLTVQAFRTELNVSGDLNEVGATVDQIKALRDELSALN